MPDVSVIIPTWNRADLLVKAVRSALGQSLPSLEILVCDDGSTDGSEDAVRALGDGRVRWIPGERGGRPAIPRNRGIRESRGEWLAFLDNDDEWLPDKLERQLQRAEQLGCRAVCANATRFIPGKGAQGNYLSFAGNRVCFDDLLAVNQVICSSVVVHRSVFDRVIGFPEDAVLKAWEDYALWLRVAALTDFAYLPEPLLIYRDDVANSIRSQEVDVLTLRRTVFADFQVWGRRALIDESYSRKLRNRLQREKIGGMVSKVVASAKRVKQTFLP